MCNMHHDDTKGRAGERTRHLFCRGLVSVMKSGLLRRYQRGEGEGKAGVSIIPFLLFRFLHFIREAGQADLDGPAAAAAAMEEHTPNLASNFLLSLEPLFLDLGLRFNVSGMTSKQGGTESRVGINRSKSDRGREIQPLSFDLHFY